MPSELEMRIQRGDKEELNKAFQEVINVLSQAPLSTEKRISNTLFIMQVQDYILEGVE
jgi:hypothetical protein